MTSRELTPKQRRFVAEYLKDLNAKQAAIRTGYSVHTAEVQGCQLLRNPKVKAAVAEAHRRHLQQAELTAGLTLQAIKRHVLADVHGDIRKLFDAEGNLRPVGELGEHEATMLAGIEVIIKNAAGGDGHTDTVHKIKWRDDQSKYVEMAAKHFQLLTEVVKVEVSDALLKRLDAGRIRNAKR